MNWEGVAQVLICGLAGWRLASLLVDEAGPWNIFGIIREIVGIRPRTELSELAKLFGCVWCLSIWTTALFWGLWYVHWSIPAVFAAMSIAVITHRITR